MYVDNTRAKASRNDQGNVLISLVRSSGDGIKPFRVELMYTLPVDEFGLRGEGKCLLPATDIFTNKIRLALHVPTGFEYEFEKGEWEEAAAIWSYDDYGQSVSERKAGERSHYRVAPDTSGDDESSFDAPEDAELESSENLVSGDSSTEEVPASITVAKPSSQPAKKPKRKTTTPAQVMTGPAGLSSIRVHLPLSGDQMAFTKIVVDKDETFPLLFSYSSNALRKALRNFIITAVLVGIVFVLFKISRVFKSWSRQGTNV